MAKARFATLVNCDQRDLVLAHFSGSEGDVFSLQLMQKDAEGRQFAIPLGTIYSEVPEKE